ncbi:putative F-box/FBD/LRR-repeat protein At1g66290 [Lolium rigidum]|uniref:putative F-box/FBD/LRR-repeat protein At1g66290 n=1 Tax=Lolium rigidum TaxID=89674 RepID=UPI001F5D05BD|nr:putative F-box/FBD/LRR-repeat protein At1g66290 [Lolium rigidum]
MAAAASHPDGGTKTRQEDEEGQPGAEDRLSALPEALRLQVLCLLPLKSAIRTGVLSTQWEALWTRRWPAPSSLDFRFAAYESSEPITEALERRGLRRLDRFALSFGIGELDGADFRRCLDYAAACAVEDLRVHYVDPTFPNLDFEFRLQPDDPHLTRLSLRGITICNPLRTCAFPALEVIQLRRVYVSNMTVQRLVAGCPLLRSLDLRYCAGLNFVSIVGAGAHLTSFTVAECPLLTSISAYGASSLRSLRYSGAYIAAYSIPATSELADICICFRRPAREWTPVCYAPGPCSDDLRRNWLELLTNLSNLTVLTLCSSALQTVSASARARSVAGNAAPCKLHNLRELQLLMFAMSNENMDDIYVFLMNCCGPRLERLFVQLPARGYQCASKKELSGIRIRGRDRPLEELFQVEPPEEAELDEDQSEAFENLMLLKMINFRGHDNEMRLVRLVLKKSTRLNQLILFTPTSNLPKGSRSRKNQPKGLKKDHMDTPQFIETKVLSLRKASPNAQIILSEPDDSAIEPLHCEGFVKVD